VSLASGLVASVWGGDPTLPAGQLPASPQIDLEHRLLLAAGRRGADPHELVERAVELVARALEQHSARRRFTRQTSGTHCIRRPASPRTHLGHPLAPSAVIHASDSLDVHLASTSPQKCGVARNGSPTRIG
jgi:hypothetical protein